LRPLLGALGRAGDFGDVGRPDDADPDPAATKLGGLGTLLFSSLQAVGRRHTENNPAKTAR